MRRVIVLAAALFACGAAQAQVLWTTKPVADGVRELAWVDGASGRLVEFQAALKAELARLMGADAPPVTADGTMGPGTRKAITALLARPEYAEISDGGTHGPVVSEALWRRLLPDAPLPTVHQRAMTVVLTYEATDYSQPAQWNFCQSMPSAQRRGEGVCRSNDPRSFITWGPRGATAGGGREVQGIVLAAEAADPRLVEAAFGARAAEVRRFVRLDAANQDTERYLCAVWMDAARAKEWADGFAAFGRQPKVREVYEAFYGSAGSDGPKMRGFYDLYAKLGRQPSEVDYAFFLDRATHSGGVTASGARANSAAAVEKVALAVTAKVPDAATAPAWKIRRAISEVIVPGNQREDRNGRDVVFFVDGATVAGLSGSETANWTKRGPRAVSGVGLSDERPAPALAVTPAMKTRGEPDALTVDERKACPLRVLNWVNPNGGSRTPPETE